MYYIPLLPLPLVTITDQLPFVETREDIRVSDLYLSILNTSAKYLQK